MNEHKAFWTLEGASGIRMMLNRLKIPGVVFFCKYGILFPPNVPIDTVVGRGIRSLRKYENEEEPSQEDIDSFHSLYIKEL